MAGVSWVLMAAVAFVGTHVLLSHPLRRPLVARLGEGTFLGVYALVAAVTLAALVWAFLAAPTTPFLWPVGNGLWAVVTLVMLLASVLLIGSMIRNPAMPTGGAPSAVPDVARGVFAITRHPMMWAVALWGLCHIAVYPVAKSMVLASAIVVLALVGAALQDRKKERLQPDTWRSWEARTSYWPFAAVIARRARLGGFGMHDFAGGLVVWRSPPGRTCRSLAGPRAFGGGSSDGLLWSSRRPRLAQTDANIVDQCFSRDHRAKDVRWLASACSSTMKPGR